MIEKVKDEFLWKCNRKRKMAWKFFSVNYEEKKSYWINFFEEEHKLAAIFNEQKKIYFTFIPRKFLIFFHNLFSMIFLFYLLPKIWPLLNANSKFIFSSIERKHLTLSTTSLADIFFFSIIFLISRFFSFFLYFLRIFPPRKEKNWGNQIKKRVTARKLKFRLIVKFVLFGLVYKKPKSILKTTENDFEWKCKARKIHYG